MKILVVGDFSSEIHEKALVEKFRELGHDVLEFGWNQYFKGSVGYVKGSSIIKRLMTLHYRIQNKFIIGSIIFKINNDLKLIANDFKPDFILIYRGTQIKAKTVKLLSKKYIVFGYNNDNPFNPKYPKYLFRHFLNSIIYYNHIFAYRNSDIEEYNKLGVQNTSLLRSFFIKSRNFPIHFGSNKSYQTDVVFVGHYENDGRDEIIKNIIDSGISFKLFGPHWEYSKHYSYFLDKIGEIQLAFENYNEILNQSKIAIVFFSKLNKDTYTRRVFEITASKTFMLCEFSYDMINIFEENKEAEYFRDTKELIFKIKYYCDNDKKREESASNGYLRLLNDGHEAKDRCIQIIKQYEKQKRLIT